MTCCCDWISELARAHARRLAAVARREGLDATDALDAVQDAFHTLLLRPDLRERADVDRVLVTITRNAARNMRRKHHRSKPHVEAEIPGDDRPDAALDRAEQTQQLSICMARLGDAHRHVITLRVLEQLTSAEAAAALGVTANHVGVLLHRARKELADCMLTGP
jgi:RNA polymerase sigma-70 factor (ECF subfamily)